jgi:ankyrin repeat protein
LTPNSIILITHGADVNALASGGETPLHFATRHPFDPSRDRIGAAKLLLQSGAKINKKDYFGRTALL